MNSVNAVDGPSLSSAESVLESRLYHSTSTTHLPAAASCSLQPSTTLQHVRSMQKQIDKLMPVSLFSTAVNQSNSFYRAANKDKKSPGCVLPLSVRRFPKAIITYTRGFSWSFPAMKMGYGPGTFRQS